MATLHSFLKKGFSMRFKLIAVFGMILLASQVHAQKVVLKNQKEKVSYIIGLGIGKNFKQQAMDIDPDALTKGLRDALSGAKPALTDQEINEAMAALKNEMAAKQKELVRTVGEKNKKEGEAFLAENKKKPEVKTLSSGLQYKVLQAGKGKKPKLTDTITVHYRGTLVSGKEFENSYQKGQPASFAVNTVIPGWIEALQMMEVGSKWQLFIPSQLAYGEQGRMPAIEPNATLIFEIELLAIQEKK
jgi:FKBP-type peptidyl-prolyl cis-trans isomerase FklB